MELLDKLKWRYAAKAMNGEKVSDEKVERILEAARLAPTSSGLQPFEIFVVTNQEVKKSIERSSKQSTASCRCFSRFGFRSLDTYTAERINLYV